MKVLFLVAGFTALFGMTGASAVEVSDDFSSASPFWQYVTSGPNVTVGVSNGKMVADFAGVPAWGGIAPGIGGAIYGNPSAFMDTTVVTSMLELDGDTSYFYAGLVARGDAQLGYDAGSGAVTGNAYIVTISGYAGNGDLQIHRISGGQQHHLAIQSFDGLGGTIDNNPLYLKMIVETVGADVQLKGLISLNSDFSDPFGVLEYLDMDGERILVPGMVGVMGSNDPGQPAMPVTAYFDNFYAADFIDMTLPGDCNGDGFVNSADLDIVRGNWGQSVSGAANGDLSGDGIVNSADLDLVRANWGATAAAAVPEPSAFLLLGLVGLLRVWKRR
jgi:hypothetical protein